MMEMDKAFWAQLDARIAANPPTTQVPERAEVSRLFSAQDRRPGTERADEDRTCSLTDWNRVLEAMTVAKAAAQEQGAVLRELASAREALAADLQRVEAENQSLKTMLQEMQADTDVKVRQIQLQAQTRVSEAEERAQVAESRAEAAECWLRRIEQASRDLLPGDQRAAA